MSFSLSEVRFVDAVEVTDYVANGSFASLKENVTYKNQPDFAVLARLVDHNAGWKGDRVYVDEQAYRFLSKSSLFAGDVVIANVGANAGTVFQIPNLGTPITLGPNAVRVRPKGLDLDRDFLYYYLSSPLGQDKLQSIITGSAQPKFNKTALRGLVIHLPSVSYQRQTVELVKALDDRITLLRETNATLEAIAQALFKSWFVDFDPVHAKQQGIAPEGMDETTATLFPDSFEESELGLVPKGWRITKVEDVAEKIGMGPFGSNIKVSTFVDHGIPVVSGQHLRHTLMEDLSFNFITEAHAEKLKNSCVYPGDVVFTHAGNIGQVALIHRDGEFKKYVLSQRQFFFRCDRSKMFSEWMTYFFRSPQGQHLLLANASQVGVPSIARPVSYLRSIEFVLSPVAILQRFSEIVDELNTQVIANRARIQTLAALRDTLLPRLISGQLRLPEAEAMLEGA